MTVASLTLLYLVFGKIFSNALDQSEKNLAKNVQNQKSLTREEVVAQIPSDISPDCKRWLQKALSEANTEPRGKVFYLLPRLGQSPDSQLSENADGRNIIGLCKNAPKKMQSLAIMDENIDRIIWDFRDKDEGELAQAFMELKKNCEDEINSLRLTEMVYQFWDLLYPGDDDPCD